MTVRDIIALDWIIGLAIIWCALLTPAAKAELHAERIRQNRGDVQFLVVSYVSAIIAGLFWPLALVKPLMRFLEWLDD